MMFLIFNLLFYCIKFKQQHTLQRHKGKKRKIPKEKKTQKIKHQNKAEKEAIIKNTENLMPRLKPLYYRHP